MCMFSGPVEVVKNTRIFSRIEQDSQYLVYAMDAAIPHSLAMILPIPVYSNSPDNLAFIDLSDNPDFFSDLAERFVVPSRSRAPTLLGEDALRVHQVGSYEASFIPSMSDFKRLDSRFRIDPAIWERIPIYENYGFAVFQLSAGKENAFHPMGFRFETRYPNELFFPTVHIHENEYAPRASYDHTLYYQLPAKVEGETKIDSQKRVSEGARSKDVRSYEIAGNRLSARLGDANDLIDKHRYLWRRSMRGEYRNDDVLICIDES